MAEEPQKINTKTEIPQEEVSFDFFRSSGPGGQNVNKVSTGVRIRWNFEKSRILNDEQKDRIRKKYPNKVTKYGNLIIESEESRSQLKNKEIVILRLNQLLNEALKTEKKRKKRKPSRGAVEARIKTKKERSEKKRRRQKPTLEKEI